MLGVMYSSLGYYIKFSFLQVPKPAPEESEGSDEVEEPSPPRRKPKPAAPPRKEAKTGHSASWRIVVLFSALKSCNLFFLYGHSIIRKVNAILEMLL